MNQVYLDSARLLTRVVPLVLVDDTFAVKGGTAINLFVRDMPKTTEPTSAGAGSLKPPLKWAGGKRWRRGAKGLPLPASPASRLPVAPSSAGHGPGDLHGPQLARGTRLNIACSRSDL